MQHLKWMAIFAILCNLGSLVTALDDLHPPLVQTKLGAVRGYVNEALDGKPFYSFTGIPFAQPPTGDLRFMDPVPLKSGWAGELDATQPAPMCVQHDLLGILTRNWSNLLGQEDCLYLNVHTPSLDSSEKLPVMVYIHGGAYLIGGAEKYPPYAFLVEDVVLVVIQYRVGFFGFLSTEDEAASGNWGLKDQTEGLRWVRDNIATFGGDPHAVTIFGESAGGASIHHQILNEESKGLFQRAIMQSGAANCFWGTIDGARDIAFEVGQRLGCARETSSLSSHQLVRCLREKTAGEISEAVGYFMKFGLFPMPSVPVVDGEYLKEHPAKLISEGKHQKVDLMAGITSHEGNFLSFQVYTVDEMFRQIHEDFKDIAAPSLGIPENVYNPFQQAMTIYRQYLGKTISFRDQADQLTEMFGDRIFNICVENAKRAYVRAIKGENHKAFWYELTYKGADSIFGKMPMQNLRNKTAAASWVGHADDLLYLFPSKDSLTTEDDRQMSSLMVKLFTNFANTGNPTPPGGGLDFVWSPATTEDPSHLRIQTNPKMAENQFEDKVKFWNAFPLPENIVVDPEFFSKFVSDLEQKKVDAEEFKKKVKQEMRQRDEL